MFDHTYCEPLCDRWLYLGCPCPWWSWQWWRVAGGGVDSELYTAPPHCGHPQWWRANWENRGDETLSAVLQVRVLQTQNHKHFNSPEGFTAPLVLLYMVLQWSWVALTQAVDVQDGHQVVQLVVGGESHGLPHWALRELSITEQAEHSIATISKRHRKISFLSKFGAYTGRCLK